jgi:hypothetical protein
MNISVSVMNCDARGSELRGFGADLWGNYGSELQYPRFTAGTVHVSMVAAARVVRTRGTPAAGLRPRPAREKGFPSSLLLD